MSFQAPIENVHWELTNHCNFRCVHCYLHEDPRRELSTGEIFRILDELEEAGVLSLTLTGGEPLLRRDFPEIYRQAHGKGFLLSVFTNGSRITPELVRLFQELPPQKVEITVNGLSPATLEAVTAKAGSHATVFRGVELLREGGIFLGLKTNALTLNSRELPAIKAWARTIPNSFFKFDTSIMARRDHDRSPLQYRLARRAVHTLLEEDGEAAEQLRQECATKADIPPEDRAVFTCVAGRESYHISAWGDLHPCHTVRNLRVSLLERSFAEAARALRARVESLRYPGDSGCGSCRIHSMCASCPGTAELEGKNALMPTEYFCGVAHDIVEKFGAAHG